MNDFSTLLPKKPEQRRNAAPTPMRIATTRLESVQIPVLTTAPALPATTLDRYCYSMMFYGCTSLTTAPSLPATTLVEGCYRYMFGGCIKIKLSTTQTGEYQTAYRIPKSGTGTTATDALKNMFAYTGGAFKGTPEINTTSNDIQRESTTISISI